MRGFMSPQTFFVVLHAGGRVICCFSQQLLRELGEMRRAGANRNQRLWRCLSDNRSVSCARSDLDSAHAAILHSFVDGGTAPLVRNDSLPLYHHHTPHDFLTMLRSTLAKSVLTANTRATALAARPVLARGYHEKVISHYEKPRNVRLHTAQSRPPNSYLITKWLCPYR